MELLFIVITIIMILAMSVSCVLSAILASRRPTSVHRSLRIFNILLLAYVICSFMQYYSYTYGSRQIGDLIWGCLSDICYFGFILSWIFIIYELFPSLRTLSRRTTAVVTVVYGCICEAIVIFTSRYDSAADRYVLTYIRFIKILIVINALFAIGVLVLALYYLISWFRRRLSETGIARNMLPAFSGTLVLYMIWTLIFDFDAVHPDLGLLPDITLIDPLLVVCCILDGAAIVFFFRKDPLNLLSEEKAPEEEPDYEAFAESVSLTKREKEVFLLICDGANNPDIASGLCISENTVKRHVNNIFHKSGVKNRYELMAAAMKFRPQ